MTSIGQRTAPELQRKTDGATITASITQEKSLGVEVICNSAGWSHHYQRCTCRGIPRFTPSLWLRRMVPVGSSSALTVNLDHGNGGDTLRSLRINGLCRRRHGRRLTAISNSNFVLAIFSGPGGTYLAPGTGYLNSLSYTPTTADRSMLLLQRTGGMVTGEFMWLQLGPSPQTSNHPAPQVGTAYGQKH